MEKGNASSSIKDLFRNCSYLKSEVKRRRDKTRKDGLEKQIKK
jgi:hypothetical protein